MTNREHKKLLRAIRHQQAMRDNQQLAKKIDRAFTRLSEDCSERVVKAVTGTLTLRNKPEQQVSIKQNRTYYRDVNPYGNKIHAVQKSRGKSTPLI